jgi:hypothetical protein
MSYSKEQVEKILKDLLDKALESLNQDGSIINLEYDEKNQECVIKMNVVIVEEDNYVGFAGY